MKKLILKKVLDKQGRYPSWLASKLGISQQTIWNWCKGYFKPDYYQLIQMAEILGVAPEDLYEDEKNNN